MFRSTDRALTRNEIDPAAAQQKLREASARVAHSDAEINARFRDEERARQMLRSPTEGKLPIDL